jgi:hypothetical protein
MNSRAFVLYREVVRFWRLKCNGAKRGNKLGPQALTFVRRSIVLRPDLRESPIGGSSVRSKFPATTFQRPLQEHLSRYSPKLETSH